jgi:hypothetical protein
VVALCPDHGLTGSYSGPEVGFGEIILEVPEACFWPVTDHTSKARKSCDIGSAAMPADWGTASTYTLRRNSTSSWLSVSPLLK